MQFSVLYPNRLTPDEEETVFNALEEQEAESKSVKAKHLLERGK